MVVQHNLTAMNSNRMLAISQGSLSKSAEKLSSGYKVNRAADDAAGLSISEKMRKQIRGLTQASLNAEDGISAVQTAEGALTEVHDMLQRMNELAVKASNGTMSLDDRQTLQDEVDQLLTEIDRVAETTKFNETYLLRGDQRGTTSITLNAHDAGLKGKFYKTDDASKIASSTIASTDSIGTVKFGVTFAQGMKVNIGGKEFIIDFNAVDDSFATNDSSSINAKEAATMMLKELRIANSIGLSGTPDELTAAAEAAVADPGIASMTGKETTVEFTITKQHVDTFKKLNFSLHVGADADMSNKISVDIDSLDTKGLKIHKLNIKDETGMAGTYAIDAISDAVAKVSAQRSKLGAIQNRLEHTIKNLDNIVENTQAAESQIRDTDMATEMVKYSNNNILAQAGQSMLAQANQANQGVLSLLG